MDILIEKVLSLNWQTMVGMFVIVWYFTRDIKKNVESMASDLHKMNTRISRIEGTVYGQKIYDSVKED